MKILFKNFLSTYALIILSIAALDIIYGAKIIYTNTIFEVLLCNALIHLAMFFCNKINSRYTAVEIGIEFLAVLAVVTICGYIFKWVGFVPIWIIMFIVLIIYSISYLLEIVRTKRDIDFINQQLKFRNKGLASDEEET